MEVDVRSYQRDAVLVSVEQYRVMQSIALYPHAFLCTTSGVTAVFCKQGAEESSK